MLAHINTITFNGLETLSVDLQTQITSGMPSFTIVGLPDKAIAESKERVRSAIQSLGLSLPAKRITINLAPADLLKEGSHFDLPVALGILCCMGILPTEEISGYIAMGELSLDASIIPVNGVLPVAMHANRLGKGLICPASQGSEAAWSGLKDIIATPDLISLINHFKGVTRLTPPQPIRPTAKNKHLDMSDVKGQESAKRALEIAAAGGHNLLMVGPPGSGKSMLAARMPSILPPLSAEEALETSMIHSVAGILKEGGLCFERPFRSPHHNASTPSLVGGGRKAHPGEISLAHNGVLFLDELPEFDRSALEALRQPLENGSISIARVNTHAVYPAKFQLIAAMNPCRCGNLSIPELACPRAPKCAIEYQAKLSGPLLDRIDMHIEVPAVSPWKLSEGRQGETSEEIRRRVIAARKIQKDRFLKHGITNLSTNAELKGQLLEEIALLENDAKNLLVTFADKNHLSARAYHRSLRLARTIADLQNSTNILKIHIAEALSYRHTAPES